jgi:hypothetical protein
MFVCIASLIIYSTKSGKAHNYTGATDTHPVVFALIQLGSYFLLLNTMVPISLIVTLEIIKFV